MALSNDDYRDILRHLDQRLRESGLEAMIDKAQARAGNFRSEDLARYTSAYLHGTIEGLEARSRTTYERALERCRESIVGEDGKPVDDIVLVAQEEDRALLGFDQISLSEAPTFDELIGSLREILDDLEASQ